MTRHPAASRARASQAATHDDPVIGKFVETAAWAQKNSRAILIGVIVLALVVAGFLYYRNYRQGLAVRAASELMTVRQVAASGDFASATTGLQDFVTRFDGTPSAAEARLLLGQILLAQGNAEQAIEAVRPLAEKGDGLVGTAAALLLAGAQESAGQPEAAEQTYMRVARSAELEFQRREALEDAARIRAERGDRAGAVELYDQLIGMTEPGSPERDVYQMRRAEISAGS